MSPFAYRLVPATDVETYRLLKADALMRGLAGQCRTPMDAVRFVFDQFATAELRQLQRVGEAALRARS